MLVEHRIDDVDEGLVAVEQPVASGEQVALEPAFALMLAEHFHYAPIGGEKLVIGYGFCFPLSIGDVKNGLQAVRERLVRAEEPEVAGACIQLDDVADELAQ